MMEHAHNNLMKLGVSLGNVPQKLKKKLVIKKNSIYFGLLLLFENGPTVRNISCFFYNNFFF
jgi:hypothetical protein